MNLWTAPPTHAVLWGLPTALGARRQLISPQQACHALSGAQVDHQVSPQKLIPEANWASLLPLRAVNRDKWGPWLWGTLRWLEYRASLETDLVECLRCRQHHGLVVQHGQTPFVYPPTIPTLPVAVLPSGLGTSKGGGRSVALPCIPTIASVDLRQVTTRPSLYRQKTTQTGGPAGPWVPPPVVKPTARNVSNHVRGMPTLPRGTWPKYGDTTPTVESVAVDTSQYRCPTPWVLDAMVRLCCVKEAISSGFS